MIQSAAVVLEPCGTAGDGCWRAELKGLFFNPFSRQFTWAESKKMPAHVERKIQPEIFTSMC